ncbi:RagB/SusD family nutrient uptake outer membrane protein [Niabella beijingensis]|uniref:RagB/SusD family nutrient uptake outer membrane protein n=1 Tax=Niabella beijingensis TaxID=2872700 RepID=UPI001CBDAD35|nr:RagB/SusD family nutrient uptake outer membrane protein [Niabella beijingensis]MBZ4190450.1 RagB/SusD family nutrient uptake outer membrane protein [Niabella beijingensis]
MKNKVNQLVLFCLLLAVAGCTRYLEERPNKRMVIISSLKDLQGILEFDSWVNASAGSGEDAADNYYITDADFAALNEYDRNMYSWNNDHVFREEYFNPWALCYNNVYRANTVLFHIDKVVAGAAYTAAEVANVKGQAFFLRGISFLNVASIWCPAYDAGTADKDLGIPLRLTPDFNIPSVRSSVKQTYEQIINDLKEAIALLPVTPLAKTRASKPVACLALARTYLYMRSYDSCYKYTSLCLSMRQELFDFSLLNPDAPFPFEAVNFEDNPEVLYYQMLGLPISGLPKAKIDSNLYKSYAEDDLRKVVYFANTGKDVHSFKGSRLGTLTSSAFSVNEGYLMRAECAARLGKKEEAINDLNALLSKRWKKGQFEPVVSLPDKELLNLILKERRKELVFTDTRWMDLKRLNKEGANIELKRIVNGKEYILHPNDSRYALPIPESVINITGMPQNPR